MRIIVTILMAITAITIFTIPAMAGAVFATDSSGNPDADLYPTTAIFIASNHLTDNTPFIWKIYDKGTKDGGDPPGCIVITEKVGCAIELASGSGSTNSEGYISPPYATGWSIPDGIDAGHKYKLWVKFGPVPEEDDDDFYVKIDSFSPLPELSTIVLTLAGLIGIFGIARLKRK